MTVIVFPYALSPYGNNLLYTPTYSRDLTIASGVQGIIDLTIPGGGCSTSAAVVVGKNDSKRAFGFKYRILFSS